MVQPGAGNQSQDLKKPRRSPRISSQSQLTKPYLPSPLTHQESTETELHKEATVTPPEGRPSQLRHHSPVSAETMMPFSSPPGDTQALSQFVYPPRALADDVEDEAAEGVWGYLIPLDARFGNALVLKRRENCSSPALE